MNQLNIIVRVAVRRDATILADDFFVVDITDTSHLIQEIENRVDPMTYGVLLDACKAVLSASPPVGE